MTTPEQLKANRSNAQKSTGPRSEKGKALASRNALRHGLTSTEVVGPGEEPAEYEAFAEALIAQLNPEGPVEEALADRIATCSWRMRRVVRLESAHATYQAQSTRNEITTGLGYWAAGLSPIGIEGHMVPRRAEVLTTLSRYEAALERSMFRAMHELERLQARRAGEHVDAPRVVDVDVSLSPGAGDE